jgi:hypothetical protein
MSCAHLSGRLGGASFLIGFYGPSDEDGMVNPQVSYKITGRLSVTLEVNVFFGKKEFTQFGQLEKDDNLYLRLRTSY